MVCGRNEPLRAELNEAVRKLGKRSKVSFTLLGFTTEMDELMTSADLYVGKPGGLTTSEALSKGLAMVVINPIPGQEERNSDHLLEQGAAIRCNNLPALAYKIDTLIDRPESWHGCARMPVTWANQKQRSQWSTGWLNYSLPPGVRPLARPGIERLVGNERL